MAPLLTLTPLPPRPATVPRRVTPPRISAPLARCSALPAFDGHPVALTGWLDADQAELTVLRRPEDDDALKVTAHCFCGPRGALEPTGTFALVPAGSRSVVASPTTWRAWVQLSRPNPLQPIGRETHITKSALVPKLNYLFRGTR